MLLKVDHYTSLARAVGRLDRDSYEARGAVYDRALAALVKRLNSAEPPYAQADIDMELLAFREAVRRVEFGDLDDQDWLAQQDEPGLDQEAAEPEPPPAMPSIPVTPTVVPADAVANTSISAGAPAKTLRPARARRRSVFGRVAVRTLLAMMVLGVGFAAYAHSQGQLDLSRYVSPLSDLMDRVAGLDWKGSDAYRLMDAGTAEPATYAEQEAAGAPWKKTVGKALWRAGAEPGGAANKSDPVLLVDVQVPERGITLALSIRRDASPNAAMSHLVEMQFKGSGDFQVDSITGVMGISMKDPDDSGGTSLAGLSVKVAPGVFLYGLSSDQGEVRRNLELLRKFSRLDIPIAFSDGRTALISLDKGEAGERVLSEVLDKWEQ